MTSSSPRSEHSPAGKPSADPLEYRGILHYRDTARMDRFMQEMKTRLKQHPVRIVMETSALRTEGDGWGERAAPTQEEWDTIWMPPHVAYTQRPADIVLQVLKPRQGEDQGLSFDSTRLPESAE